MVAQAFANRGCSVLAIDALASCTILARATLGMSRARGEACASVAESVISQLRAIDDPDLAGLLSAEEMAYGDGSGELLSEFDSKIPQVWREPTRGGEWLLRMQKLAGKSAFATGNLMASHYAGTYFGLGQTVRLDQIRTAIQRFYERDLISTWVHDALLSALMSAASRAVFSAGKHFAQPLANSSGRKSQFYRRRLMEDRSISIVQAFRSAARRLDDTVQTPGHEAICADVLTVREKLIAARPALIYADPPYTAQQYSRFYHVLETLATYQVPRLQLVRGGVTRGVYGEDRFKSQFCSRTTAPNAFRELIDIAHSSGATLAVSYSINRSGAGNARMISLEGLLELCQSRYRRVEAQTLEHVYRQFNSRTNSRADRSDPELLIVCTS